ncbi:MAG TPA: TPM domain-containing protein [Candidatus Cybelea sp.]|nr:TPM domain-containing protein [Candidatus Cybelea sp.]
MRCRLSARAALAALALAAWAAPALAADFALPTVPTHYVTDNAGALSAATRERIENELRAYETQTGHQVIVWIASTTGGVPLETYTGESADAWKIGRRGHDDGAVLFLFMRDRRVRIEVGYGLESALTDADAHRIIADAILPPMRAGNVDLAVSHGVDGMLSTITPSFVRPPRAMRHPPLQTFMWWLIVLLGGLFIMVRLAALARYGYLVTREGSADAMRDMKRSKFWGTHGTLSRFGFAGAGASGGGFSSGGFSAGGGSFGGGGASGGW